MSNDWQYYAKRIKYVTEGLPAGKGGRYVYICLDGKFHSWAVEPQYLYRDGKRIHNDWSIRTVAEPEIVIERYLIATWMAEISK